MTGDVANEGRGGINWRIVGWGAAATVLLLPFVAMQFTSEVQWDGFDFLFAAVLLAIAGGTLEYGARLSGDRSYRGGVAVAALASFLLVWANAAVGILGDEGNPANLLFLGVIAIAIVGSFAVRFRAAGLARIMTAAAGAQAAVGAIALAAGWTSPGGAGLYEVALSTFLFGGLWLLSAWLFGRAAQRTAAASR